MEDDITFTKGGMFNYMGTCSSDDEFLLGYMDADKLKEGIEKRSGAYESVYAKLENVADDDNPIIVQMKFR